MPLRIIETVLAMAYSRNEARRKLLGLNEKVTEHLTLLILLPEDQNINHWKNELASWLITSYRATILTKGKRVKQIDLEETLFALDQSLQIKSVIQELRKDYAEIPAPSEVVVNETTERLRALYKHLARHLLSPSAPDNWKEILTDTLHLTEKS